MSGILGRRAAVLGLGVLHDEQAIPILIEAWELNYYANREVALAFAMAEAYNATDPLIELFERFPDDQVFPALCLGELFAPRPQRLGRFLNGQNYTIRNGQLVPYQGLANEFLMMYLIPAFGDRWQ